MGAHTGLSAGMLSKLERGQIFPTLPTLLRIALVFGVGLDHFFVDGGKGPIMEVVRAKDRLRLPDTMQGKPAFYFESLDFPVSDAELSAYLAEFPAGGAASVPHAHEGVELIYVIRGAMMLSIHGGETRLEAGDSVYFEAGFEHSYCGAGDDGCQAIVTVREEAVA
ncbi:XRE family transcriptional regulator [Rhodobacteraceae bacterium D3-12]|nr:XRE family transcriptional regulator [Rhodobacteraceae bacterium D3-12]